MPAPSRLVLWKSLYMHIFFNPQQPKRYKLPISLYTAIYKPHITPSFPESFSVLLLYSLTSYLHNLILGYINVQADKPSSGRFLTTFSNNFMFCFLSVYIPYSFSYPIIVALPWSQSHWNSSVITILHLLYYLLSPSSNMNLVILQPLRDLPGMDLTTFILMSSFLPQIN